MQKNFLEKIVVNIGLGRASAQPGFSDKFLPAVAEELGMITGQKPQHRAAKKSIAGFKLREGVIVGLKTTLRGKRMNEFLQKLIHIVLPRVRDFRGIKTSAIDTNGNLSIGIKEHTAFPEINTELLKANFGLEITLVPKRHDREKTVELYKAIGILFKK